MAFRKHDGETLVHGVDPFIGESEDDGAGLVEYAEGQNVTKIQIERDDDAVVRASSLDKFSVRRG